MWRSYRSEAYHASETRFNLSKENAHEIGPVRNDQPGGLYRSAHNIKLGGTVRFLSVVERFPSVVEAEVTVLVVDDRIGAVLSVVLDLPLEGPAHVSTTERRLVQRP